MIERITERLARRARWFDVIETRGSSTPVSFANNRLHSITDRHNSGFGVRVNVNGKTGFSYTNDESRLEETADRALALAAWGDEEDFDLPAAAPKPFEPYDTAIESFDPEREIAGIEESIAALRARFPAAMVDADVSASSGSARIINSRGLDASYRSSSYSVRLSATLILDDGTRIETGESASILAPGSHEIFREKIIRKLEAASTPASLGSGKVPVLLSPRAFARFAGIMAAGLNAKSVWKGISPFADRLGEGMFVESLTVRDDPTLADSPYSYPFDDEGIAGTGKLLVDRGTIATFINDLKYAGKLGAAPTGNGTRGYSSLPYPSFSNIIIDPGTETLESIIGSMKRGILVEQFIGLGQSNTITGDFSANLDLAYLIENGKIAGRVKDCMIADNLFKLLKSEIVMSAERERTGSVLAPSALFPALNFTG
ncbi:MAG: TldD/PmbA family protein [Spirochaetes bacterium]|nr:TldD/PmbA family protein [Spirochaetota bacterium]